MLRFLLSDASKLRRRWLGSHQSFLFRNAFSLELSTNSATSSTSSTVFKPRSSRARCHQQCVYRNGCSAWAAEMSRKFLWVWNESRDVLWSLPPCFLIFLSPCLLWPCTTSLFEESLCIFQSIPTSLMPMMPANFFKKKLRSKVQHEVLVVLHVFQRVFCMLFALSSQRNLASQPWK